MEEKVSILNNYGNRFTNLYIVLQENGGFRKTKRVLVKEVVAML